MLWDYNLEYMRILDDRRRTRLEGIQSGEQLENLRAEVRLRLEQMWGALPTERSPLNPRPSGRLARSDYWIEKLTFESLPGFHVSANLYGPKEAKGKLPAVVVACGHAAEGKADPSYQKLCVLLAKNGFLALICDPVGQGERVQIWDKHAGASLVGAGTPEHRVLGHNSYLVGQNLMRYRVWDASRAIDYLLSRDDVDPNRIAMAGNSGGGMETLQFAAFDSRLSAAFPSCAVAGFRAKSEALLIADPEQVLYGSLRRGIEHSELLAVLAPKPLLIGSATRDYVPIAAARATFGEVSRIYDLAGARDRLSMVETDDLHGLNQELRVGGVDFLSRWISPRSRNVVEGSIETLSEEQLRCTTTGQVTSSFGGKTMFDLLREQAKKIAPDLKPPASSQEQILFHSNIRTKVSEITRVGSFRREMGIFVPDLVFEAGAFARGVAVVVAEQGKNDPEVRRRVIDPLITAGYKVVALDLRGWGESRPNLKGVRVSYDWDDFFAYRGLEIGRPLLGQRMKDLLVTAAARAGRRSWTLVGVGAGSLIAAHAAVLDPRVEALIAVDPLISYRSLLDDPLASEPFSSYLPGVLGAYDLRDLYAAIAPRRTLILNPRDPRRNKVQQVAAWEELDWVSRTFEAVGAPEAFDVKAGLDIRETRAAITSWLA